jgi:hypothetical protein
MASVKPPQSTLLALFTLLWALSSVYYVVKYVAQDDWPDALLYLWLGIGSAGMWIIPRIARRILLAYFVAFELLQVIDMATGQFDLRHLGRAIVTLLFFLLVWNSDEKEEELLPPPWMQK